MAALRSGFRRTMCPLGLLDIFDAKEICPLGTGTQTNPIYNKRPDQEDSIEVYAHCHRKIGPIHDVVVAHVENKGYFLAAQIPLLACTNYVGWINIWNGHDLNSPGTLYCDVLDLDNENTSSSTSTLSTRKVEECCICLQELSQPARALLCGHSFHADCLRDCLQTSTKCPMCRYDSWDTMRKHCACAEGCKLAWFLDGWECAAHFQRRRKRKRSRS